MSKTTELNKQFVAACAAGDEPSVQRLIQEGANRWKVGFRAACGSGNQRVVDLLAERAIGGKKEAQGKEWTNGLAKAAECGQKEIVELALANEAVLTPSIFYKACSSGNRELVELLFLRVREEELDLAAAFLSSYGAGHRDLALFFLKKGAVGWNSCFLPAKLAGDKPLVSEMLSRGAAYWPGERSITLTFGDIAENHAGMQKIGNLAAEGFSLCDLEAAKARFEGAGCRCELVHLNEGLDRAEEADEAYVLVVRDALTRLMAPGDEEGSPAGARKNRKGKGLTKTLSTPKDPEDSPYSPADRLLAEQLVLDWDTKAKMRGAVKNKNARYNLCYGPDAQEPDYRSGKGRVVAFDDVPLTQKLWRMLPSCLGEKGEGLVCEGNLYYDSKKTGIGYHGDSERRKVVAVRLGTSIPLHYMWFQQGEPVGTKIELELSHGDLYVMGWKAVGFDWKRRKVLTLRHAAGCPKYTTYRPKPSKTKK